MTWENWIIINQIEITTITSFISAVWAIGIPILLLIYWNKLTRKLNRRKKISEIRDVLYPELYEKLQITMSYLFSTYGFGYSKTYDNYLKEDIENECKIFELNFCQTKEILDLYATKRADAITKLKEYEEIIKIGKALDTYNEFYNFFVLKKLFFSENIINVVQNLEKDLSKYKANLQSIRDFKYIYKIDDKKEIWKIRKENNWLIDIVKKKSKEVEEKIRKELVR